MGDIIQFPNHAARPSVFRNRKNNVISFSDAVLRLRNRRIANQCISRFDITDRYGISRYHDELHEKRLLREWAKNNPNKSFDDAVAYAMNRLNPRRKK